MNAQRAYMQTPYLRICTTKVLCDSQSIVHIKTSQHYIPSMRTLLSFIFLLWAAVAMGQTAQMDIASSDVDSVQLRVYFHQGKSFLVPSYRDNEERLTQFVNRIRRTMADSTLFIQDICITSSASPEGNTEANYRLSVNRGISIKQYLMCALDMPDSVFRINPIGEDWAGFRELALKYNVPHRDEVIAIIDQQPQMVTVDGKATDKRKVQLMALDGGKVWDYILNTIFPELRSGNNNVICHIERREPVPQTIYVYSNPDRPSHPQDGGAGSDAAAGNNGGAGQQFPGNQHQGAPDGSIPSDGIPSTRAGKYYFAVKTNALFDLVACPNVEVEFPIGKHVSLMAEHWFPWYVFHHNSYAYELLNTGGELRYWFGDRSKKSVLQGFFVGIYGSALKYDFEYNDKGYQGESVLSTGATVGKSWTLGRRWRMEASLSVGYAHCDYRYYERNPEIDLLIWQRTGKYNWIGPTKAKLSFGWLMGVPRHKKGGNR